MKLAEALTVMAKQRDGELVITAASTASREWYRETNDIDATFYLQASMGISPMVTLALAMAIPDATVWTFTGDGGLVMNPSVLATEAQYRPPNMRHFVVMNRVFSGTGKLPLANNAELDFVRVAEGFGVPAECCHTVRSVEELESHADGILSDKPGYALVILEVEPATDAPPPQPPLDGPEMKYRFARTIEQRHGVKVFGPQGV